MSNNIFLGRQPILDRDRKTFGFELLFRDGPNPTTFIEDPDDASRTVMERALLHWGMERIIGDRFGFINAGPNLIRSGIHRALPSEGIIFEVREDESFDAETITAFRRARSDGYHFALDNITGFEQLVRSRLLPFVSMVKVEADKVEPGELPRLVNFIRNNVPGVVLVAEKVESIEQFVVCSEAEFDLFQGYFFAKPELLSRAERPARSTSVMTLMAEMQSGDIDINRTEELVAADPALAYRILSVVNSSAYGLDQRVDSLRHAIVMLGISQVRHLAVLLTLGGSEQASEELVALGAVRARMSSQLQADPDRGNAAFTVGLLSVTDAIFHAPMDELVDDLPVSDEVAEALVHGSGDLGRTLDIVKACERSDIEALQEFAPNNIGQMHNAFGEAIDWSNQIRKQLGGRNRMSKVSFTAGSERPLPAG